MRRPLTALLVAALWFSASALAAEARAGRLAIEARGDAWQAQSDLPFAVRARDGAGEFAGSGALLRYADAAGRTYAAFFVASTWSEPRATMEANCRSGRAGWLREVKPDGFVTHGCAMVGPSLAAAQLGRAAPYLTPHAGALQLPERGHVLTVVVATNNGGVVLVQGYVDAAFGMAEPFDWPYGAPKPIPLATAAYAGALGDAAVRAAKSVFPRFVLPPVALAPDTPNVSASK